VAFNTRVVLEQAKGVVAEAARVDMDQAFALLRGYARHHNLLLSEVARQVIDRELAADALVIQPVAEQAATAGLTGPASHRPLGALGLVSHRPCGATGIVVSQLVRLAPGRF
jgi:hypothetical protein